MRDLLSARFPDADGYEIETSRLSGPLRGSVFHVSRGDFRARVSLQMYQRGRSTASETHELRLLAFVTSRRIERARRRGSRWRAVGRAAGLSLGAAMFVGAAWAMAALFGNSLLAAGSPLWVASVVPACLLGWMTGASVHERLASRARLALRAASADAGGDARLSAALQAWDATIPALTGQRELALGRAVAQPFRARALVAPGAQ